MYVRNCQFRFETETFVLNRYFKMELGVRPLNSRKPATVVMKICGWQDIATMQRYVRLAGVEEAGATECLRFLPSEEAVMEKVVSIFDYKA